MSSNSELISNIVIQHGEIKYKLNELLTVRMVMEVFDVTRVTVYNWLGKKSENGTYPDGKFPHAFKLKNEGKIYIPINDVKHLIDMKTQGYPIM